MKPSCGPARATKSRELCGEEEQHEVGSASWPSPESSRKRERPGTSKVPGPSFPQDKRGTGRGLLEVSKRGAVDLMSQGSVGYKTSPPVLWRVVWSV